MMILTFCHQSILCYLFLLIGNAYFSFILSFSTFYSLLDTLHNISCMNFIKQHQLVHALGVYIESIKWSNRSKTADFGSTLYSTVCLRDHELHMCFPPFETFYPRHVQRPITLAVCDICP